MSDNDANTPINPELLRSMMDCVDTSVFSPQQLHKWGQMKQRIRIAAERNEPMPVSLREIDEIRSSAGQAQQVQEPTNSSQSLHREASIQDVLSCLLDNQPPSNRLLSSNGSSFLLSSETKKSEPMKQTEDTFNEDCRPTLKSLLSSNDFSMTEKKESLRHLLSFIDNSFASTPEPMTQVYQDCQDGKLERLSSLQLMRQFMPPTQAPANGSQMGRTTSFEIIQAMLNATSNAAIQKPMSSQDSFRFQHLARTLESIESDMTTYDNEDYGGEEVIQVDNLDNLLESSGFVNTQNLTNMQPDVYGYPSYNYNNNSDSIVASSNAYAQSYDPPNINYPMDAAMKQEMQPTYLQQQQLSQMNYRAALLQQQAQQAANGLQANYANPQYSAMLAQQARRLGTQNSNRGSGKVPGMCSALGCTHPARVKGMCKQHGGGRRCKVEGCMKSAQTGHLCIAHGGGKPCKVDGCPKTAQSRGLCKQHGGGVRCKFEGCTKSCQSGGFCRGHGGGKRCEYPGCSKWAQKNGHCAKHAQEIAQKMQMVQGP